jgi:hypothetical protein
MFIAKSGQCGYKKETVNLLESIMKSLNGSQLFNMHACLKLKIVWF